LPLSKVVQWLGRDTARAVGLADRGLIAPGYKADLNVIDLDRLALHAPEVTYDLPAGGRRLVQRADGYAATIVSGAVVQRDGRPTGKLPGRLVRGAQAAPRRQPRSGPSAQAQVSFVAAS
jgi:N-acyl-D-aspartate/D-glutamate deacylase